MADKSGVSDQIISLPKGGGELKGLGEKFRPDLHTGTGKYTVPIAIPPGRNGFQPQLSLNYSAGSPNGPFGIGWILDIPNVSRKTSQGIPKYIDKYENGEPVWHSDEDTFILSGADDLVYAGKNRYRPRIEISFARIQKIKSEDGKFFWEVTSRSGTKNIYGKTEDSRIFINENGNTKIFNWLLNETIDTFGNKIVYTYKRDTGSEFLSQAQTHLTANNYPEERYHGYNQVYLHSIEYVDYGDEVSNGSAKYLHRIEFDYGECDENDSETNSYGNWDIRADRFSSYRSGFEIRTSRRCKRILIKRRLDGDTSAKKNYEIVKSYDLSYSQDEFSNISLLKVITLKGYKDSQIESFPPIVFEYTKFAPEEQRCETFSGDQNNFPESSLANPNYEIVDLFGDGLPSVVNSTNTQWRYWRNSGDLKLESPKSMKYAPPGAVLSDDGVQFADLNGDGSVELLLTTASHRGFFVKDSSKGDWIRFHPFSRPPSFNLEDKSVKLVDMNGDGVMDILATFEQHFLYIPNANTSDELTFDDPVVIQRDHNLVQWPDLSFDDPTYRVRLADMSGDGLQDIVLVNSGRIDYWSNLGYGKFGKRITMNNSPRFPDDSDLRRVFLADVNGDGLADIVYDSFGRLHIWINQSGNSWSKEIIVNGTPIVTNSTSIRVADMKGTGNSGILWSYDYSPEKPQNYYYIDLTGARKPLLLYSINNNIGATTLIEYVASTFYYLRDLKKGLKWKTTPPFPIQVVSRVTMKDAISHGKISTEYSYHHGYWDGRERDYLGFGRVDQRDTEFFEDYHALSLSSDTPFDKIPVRFFSPPTETRMWFHQGPVGDDYDGWEETDFSNEYWNDDLQVLFRPQSMLYFLNGLSKDVKRDVLRALRGRILRTELYALDGDRQQARPYTVTESLHGVRSIVNDIAKGGSKESCHNFFPYQLAERFTQWERGNEPMSRFQFMDNYDEYGQSCSHISIAVPRGRNFRVGSEPGEPYIATQTLTVYAKRDDYQKYVVDKVARTYTFEILNNGEAAVLDLKKLIEEGKSIVSNKRVVGLTVNYYDGPAFEGLPFGHIGEYGAIVRTENLVLTKEILYDIYKSNSGNALLDSREPPYLSSSADPAAWTEEYPQQFRDLTANLGGYIYRNGNADSVYLPGYYSVTKRQCYDFHNDKGSGRGLVYSSRNPLGADTSIVYDSFDLLPTNVIDPAGLITKASYNYRVTQPSEVTDPNGNSTLFGYSNLGFLESIAKVGKTNQRIVGDTPTNPSTRMIYDQSSFLNRRNPISIRTIQRIHHVNENNLLSLEHQETIQKVEYYDGFSRLVQTRTQAEDIIFSSPQNGDAGLSTSQSVSLSEVEVQNRPGNDPQRVVVTGWQVYDNKGRVVEKYEPFFSVGWEYDPTIDSEIGQKMITFYDPRGHTICTVHPDGSQRRFVHGVPLELSDPTRFNPTPWERYIYDANDNAGRTHGSLSKGYQHHWNTPSSEVVDGLGRVVKAVERNGIGSTESYTTGSSYDISGNIIAMTDPLGRVAIRYTYDLNNQAIRIEQIDSGILRKILDAAGNTIEQRDSKGAVTLFIYDKLDRPVLIWSRDKMDQSITLSERLVYGDAADSELSFDNASNNNLLGMLYKHYDEAGLLTFESYDFKGNILEKVREVISNTAMLSVFDLPAKKISAFRVNWDSDDTRTLESLANGLLDRSQYRTSFTYDALDRLKSILYPQDADNKRKYLHPYYNRAGHLEQIRLDNEIYVEHIAYNARGQRILVVYGNGVMSRYGYDLKTFRLVRMLSEYYTSPRKFTYRAKGNSIQDFVYEYDLIGNVITVHNYARESGIPNTPHGINRLDQYFTYDPLYRTLSATGRECDSMVVPDLWNDIPKCQEVNHTRSYLEEYIYDIIGNLTHQSHRAGSGGFTRRLRLASNGNRLATVCMGETSYNYVYDANGNLIQESDSRHFEWDHSDRMRTFRVQPSNSDESSLYAQYLYDSSGRRVKKLVRKGRCHIEDITYIDDIFEHHHIKHGKNLYENNTLHIMDNKIRIVLVRIGNPFSDDATPAIKYILGDHLSSSNVVMDVKGNSVNREEYTPYGETSYGCFSRKRYRFNSKERDEESGFYYYGMRYYSPWLARWVSCDPAGMIDGINIYSYVRGNPIGLIDNTGMQSEYPMNRELYPTNRITRINRTPGSTAATSELTRSSGHPRESVRSSSIHQGSRATSISQIHRSGTEYSGYGVSYWHTQPQHPQRRESAHGVETSVRFTLTSHEGAPMQGYRFVAMFRGSSRTVSAVGTTDPGGIVVFPRLLLERQGSLAIFATTTTPSIANLSGNYPNYGISGHGMSFSVVQRSRQESVTQSVQNQTSYGGTITGKVDVTGGNPAIFPLTSTAGLSVTRQIPGDPGGVRTSGTARTTDTSSGTNFLTIHQDPPQNR